MRATNLDSRLRFLRRTSVSNFDNPHVVLVFTQRIGSKTEHAVADALSDDRGNAEIAFVAERLVTQEIGLRFRAFTETDFAIRVAEIDRENRVLNVHFRGDVRRFGFQGFFTTALAMR